MGQPYLIIDGYNLMHAAGIARDRYGPGQLERARQRLQRFLAEHLSTAAKARTTIVYDAFASVSDHQRQRREHEILIQFARQGCDADTEIEELLQKHSSPRQIIVVSSDHRIQKAARRRRAKSIDSEDFLTELETVRPHQIQAKDTQSNDRMDPALNLQPEMRRWMSMDSEIEAADPPPESRSANPEPKTEFDTAFLKQLQRDVNNGGLN